MNAIYELSFNNDNLITATTTTTSSTMTTRQPLQPDNFPNNDNFFNNDNPITTTTPTTSSTTTTPTTSSTTTTLLTFHQSYAIRLKGNEFLFVQTAQRFLKTLFADPEHRFDHLR